MIIEVADKELKTFTYGDQEVALEIIDMSGWETVTIFLSPEQAQTLAADLLWRCAHMTADKGEA